MGLISHQLRQKTMDRLVIDDVSIYIVKSISGRKVSTANGRLRCTPYFARNISNVAGERKDVSLRWKSAQEMQSSMETSFGHG